MKTTYFVKIKYTLKCWRFEKIEKIQLLDLLDVLGILVNEILVPNLTSGTCITMAYVGDFM